MNKLLLIRQSTVVGWTWIGRRARAMHVFASTRLTPCGMEICVHTIYFLVPLATLLSHSLATPHILNTLFLCRWHILCCLTYSFVCITTACLTHTLSCLWHILFCLTSPTRCWSMHYGLCTICAWIVQPIRWQKNWLGPLLTFDWAISTFDSRSLYHLTDLFPLFSSPFF